jgi:hypothetical protein
MASSKVSNAYQIVVQGRCRSLALLIGIITVVRRLAEGLALETGDRQGGKSLISRVRQRRHAGHCRELNADQSHAIIHPLLEQTKNKSEHYSENIVPIIVERIPLIAYRLASADITRRPSPDSAESLIALPLILPTR